MNTVETPPRPTASAVRRGTRTGGTSIELSSRKGSENTVIGKHPRGRSTEQHLHWVVEKWFAPSQFGSVHPKRTGRVQPSGERYVCVEARSEHGIVEVIFFRHRNWEWSVLPPRSS